MEFSSDLAGKMLVEMGVKSVYWWGSEGESEKEECVCVFCEMKRNESSPSIAGQEGEIFWDFFSI